MPSVEEGMTFQSYYTLKLLHDATEFFGGVPLNGMYRKPGEWPSSVFGGQL